MVDGTILKTTNQDHNSIECPDTSIILYAHEDIKPIPFYLNL